MDFEQIKVTKERAAVQQIVDGETYAHWIGNDPRVTTRETAELLRRMVITLESYLVAQEPQPVQVVERAVTATAYTYDSFWDWFKAGWVPRRLWRYGWLRPVRRAVTSTVVVRATTDVKVIYPKLRLAFEKELVVAKAGPIRWDEAQLQGEVTDGLGR